MGRASSFGLSLLRAVVAVALSSPAEAHAGPRLHVVTFMTADAPVYGYLQVSAERQSLHPKILGYGQRAWWPDGLGAKINALRRFVHHEADDEELVLFMDAYDTMLFGDRAEIVSTFESMERELQRSIFFNCEKVCFPPFPDICTDYPESPFEQWRYLNSGLFIARVGSLKDMLRDPVDDVMKGSDQAWYQRYFRHHPDRVAVDTRCQLLCATQGIGPKWGLELAGRRLENVVSGTTPAAVHFVSDAHWAMWRDGSPTTEIGEMFGALYPQESARLFDRVEVVARAGAAHHSLMSLSGDNKMWYLRIMRAALCAQCRLAFSGDRECMYVSGLLSPMCSDLLLAVLLGLLACICAMVLVARRCAVRLPKPTGKSA